MFDDYTLTLQLISTVNNILILNRYDFLINQFEDGCFFCLFFCCLKYEIPFFSPKTMKIVGTNEIKDIHSNDHIFGQVFVI